MNDVKYSTENEKKLIQAIQRTIGALANGYIGTDTLTSIAGALGAECFPVTLKMYGVPTIVGRDIVAFDPNGPLSSYAYSMLGSFTYPRATTPCSILVNDGKVICGAACHAFLGYPESVIYKTSSGKVGITRAKSTADLPSATVTAVGGLGLCGNYNPAAEGFTGSYADVLRGTNHNVLGYKRGLWYGVYAPNMTGAAVNVLARDKFKFEYALLLDGGGLAAINGSESFAKINTGTKQGYGIQFKE